MNYNNTEGESLKAQNLLSNERKKNRILEDELLRIKAELSMYSAVDRNFAKEIIDSIDYKLEANR